MKRWALITIMLYLLLLVGATLPLHQACFGWGEKPMKVAEALAMMRHGSYWIWIGAAVLGQILLLAVPVAVAERGRGADAACGCR